MATDFDVLLMRCKNIAHAAVTTSTEKVDRLQELIRLTEEEMKNNATGADEAKCS